MLSSAVCYWCVWDRPGQTIPEMESIKLELKFATKEIHPQIILIQKYFFHDNPTWNINYYE